MLSIPIQDSATTYTVFVVLEDNNIERIRQHDPTIIVSARFGEPFKSLRLREVCITYAAPGETETIIALAQAGKAGEIIRYITRGFRVRPEDSDSPYQLIGRFTVRKDH